MDSSLIEYRAVIKFLVKEGSSAREITDRLAKVYQQDAPKYSTVAKWAAEFKRGRQSLEDDPRSGRPLEVTTPEVIRRVEDLVMADRRLKVKEVATEVGISEGSVFNILHDHLHLSKVSARWVPRNLQVQDRQQRMQLSSQLLELCRRDPEDFHLRLVTGDETWVHHWDPESKIASKQWKHSDSPPPRKFRTQSSAGKVMASVFWDSKGLLLIDYLPRRSTITGAYYSDLMVKLRHAIKTISFFMTMSWCTRAAWHKPQSIRWASKSWLTHPTVRIWPQATSTCFVP